MFLVFMVLFSIMEFNVPATSITLSSDNSLLLFTLILLTPFSVTLLMKESSITELSDPSMKFTVE